MFANTSDPAYPTEAVLNYVGETVAVQQKKYFSGIINVEVDWTPTISGEGSNATVISWGTLSAVISDLEDVGSGLPLYYDPNTADNDLTNSSGEDLTPSELAAAALSPVRRIVIEGVSITSDSNDKLRFTASLARPAGENDTTDNLSIVHGGLGSQPTDIGGGTIEGKFLGSGLNGPLAVLGGWSITNTNNDIGAEKPTAYRAAGDPLGVRWDSNEDGVVDTADEQLVGAVTDQVGSVTVRSEPIYGAFGADLP